RGGVDDEEGGGGLWCRSRGVGGSWCGNSGGEVAAVAVGLWMVGRRVGASGIVDRIDRKVGSIFGFAGKSPPENFSGVGRPAEGGGRPAVGCRRL
nr:hypothetical protein [Tanacetum cinerariifolium]